MINIPKQDRFRIFRKIRLNSEYMQEVKKLFIPNQQFFDSDLASRITASGREIIKNLSEVFEENKKTQDNS